MSFVLLVLKDPYYSNISIKDQKLTQNQMSWIMAHEQWASTILFSNLIHQIELDIWMYGVSNGCRKEEEETVT